MRKFLYWIMDYTAITVGVMTIITTFIKPESDHLEDLITSGAVLCSLYILRALYLWFIKPKFDWHLHNGNFLRKVICIAVLTPCLLTSLIGFKNLLGDASIKDSKELVKEDALYKSDIDCCGLKDKQTDPPLLWSIYYHFIDPGNQHMTSTQNGRGWAGLIAILGVFLLNGLLVSSIVGWIDSRKEKWLKGEVRYKWFLKFKGHYVIIGGNDVAVGIVNQILEKSSFNTHILIQTSCDVENFRRELFSTLNERQQQRIIIYYGNRNSEEDIKDLCISKAKEVYILGEDTRTDDVESYHDTMNMECLSLIYQDFSLTYRVKVIKWLNYAIKRLDNILKKASEPQKKFIKTIKTGLERMQNGLKMTCRVMFEYQTSFSIFQISEISNEIKTYINFKPFNYYEMWAQKVFINKEIDSYKLKSNLLNNTYLPLEGVDGITQDSDKYVHLFIVGMSRMGIAMAIEAAHLAHYPNYDRDRKIRTKITFIDKNAAEEKDFFIGRFKELFRLSHWCYGTIQGSQLVWNTLHMPEECDHLGGDFIDVEWEFINGGIENCGTQKYICSIANKDNSIVTIAMCLPEPSRCLAAALYLDRNIYEKANQILVYNRYGDSLINQMTHKNVKQINPFHNKLRAFGMASGCYDSQIINDAETIAKRLNQEYNKLYLYVDEGKGLDKSDVAKWWSNIYAANSIWTKLRCTKWQGNRELNKKEIYYLARTEHSRWNMEQLLMNYRPLTCTEQEEVKNNIMLKNPKKGEMAHFDICSFEVLKQIDRNSIRYDWGLSKILPSIYTELTTNITEHND